VRQRPQSPDCLACPQSPRIGGADPATICRRRRVNSYRARLTTNIPFPGRSRGEFPQTACVRARKRRC
jgi:hypothetical protein